MIRRGVNTMSSKYLKFSIKNLTKKNYHHDSEELVTILTHLRQEVVK